jgi:D-lactate dehydrogenase
MKAILITEGDELLEHFVSEALPTSRIISQPRTLDLERLNAADEIEGLCITVRSPVGAEAMDAFPNLKIIVTGSAGFDHIDVRAAAARGIAVCNIPQYGPAVAEFNIALMLSLARKLHIAHVNTLQRDFSIEGLLGRNLSGKTLGIIGAGNIGAHIAKLADAFGMKVIATDPAPNPDLGLNYVPLNEILHESDFIAVCCPLTPATKHMLGKPEFKKMKRGVIIVNTSRGAVMDTQSLVWALDKGIVAAAALDVLEGETLLSNEALIRTLGGDPEFEEAQTIAEDLTLIRHPRVLVTPHIAYYSEDSLREIRERTAKTLADFAAGKPVGSVAGTPSSIALAPRTPERS